MKKALAVWMAFALLLCFAACQKEPEVDVLTEDELQAILGEVILGDKLDMDKYTEDEKQQIEDALDKDGFTVNDDGVVAPKNPVSDEKLDEIVNDAQNKGEVDLGGYDNAQKEQIKDKLEEEDLQPDPEQGDDGVVDVIPIPDLTDEEIKNILLGFGIDESSALAEEFKVLVNMKSYPKKQQEQIIRLAGLWGLDYVTEGTSTYFAAAKIHLDQVEDNPNE